MLERIETVLPSICREAFGDAARSSGLRALAHGAESYIFAFELERDDAAPQALALKLYTSGAEAAALEYRTTRGACAQGFPAAELLHLERDAERLGFAFTIMKRIEGRQLAQAMQTAERPRARDLLRRFSTLLADLHRLDPVPVLGPGSGGHACLDDELQLCAQILAGLEVPELLPVLEWLTARRRALNPRGPSLIHQDYHPRNVLLDDRDALHVIDWTIARVTDPRSDLALTVLMLAQSGFASLRQPILDDYETASAQSLDDMDFFDVMACLKSFAGRYAVLDDAEHKRPALWARVSRRPDWAAQLAGLRANPLSLRVAYDAIRELTSLEIPRVEALLSELEGA
jgi:aminoglycoside phosphotransferase (APT) family kinase protein